MGHRILPYDFQFAPTNRKKPNDKSFDLQNQKGVRNQSVC